MKFAIDDIEESLRSAEVGTEETNKVIENLQKIAEELAKDRAETVKKKFVLVSGLEGEDITETPLWLFQVEENFNHEEVVPLINKTTDYYKNSSRKKKQDVSTMEKAIRNIPKKDFSNFGLGLKTKEPVIIVKGS